MEKVTQFYRKNADGTETCYHVVTKGGVDINQAVQMMPFFQEFPGQKIVVQNAGLNGTAFEVGTRPSYFTPWSTNAVSALQACDLPVIRIEETRRVALPAGVNKESYQASFFDRMTECVYPPGVAQFLVEDAGDEPEPVFTVPVLERGGEVLEEVSEEYGLAFDPGLIEHFVQIFRELDRDPTIVELFQIGQMCSDHSRHITWNARLNLNGEEMPFTLFDLAKAPYKQRLEDGTGNHLIAFFDNASVIEGFEVKALIVTPDGRYVRRSEIRHPVTGAETHNYPTTVCADPGSITGLVGCYRDPQATGRGGVLLFSSAGFSTGLLRIPGYHIPGEEFVPDVYPGEYETPLGIKLGAPKGAWRGGNQCGVPVLHGFSRSVELMVGSQRERYGYLKTIMYAGNTAYILNEHLQKGVAVPGLLIIQIGGGANPVGLGGAAGSSQILGSQDLSLDYDAVQRGNPQMARKVANVLRRCTELKELNPIISIHDQGAGGPCNVITELIEESGGRVRLYEINLDDPNMSTVQIWCAEYQERQGLLIAPESLELFEKICDDEDCPLEVLGETTDDGKITVFATPAEEVEGKTCVDLSIERVVSGLPETVLKDSDVESYAQPLEIPEKLTLPRAFEMVVAQEDVGSKRHLVHRVDRSVGGLVARQQCCGPLQLPVADVAVSVLAHFSDQGMAAALGEQPLIMMLDQGAGGRMALAEALTNLMAARITAFEDISLSGNWMLAARAAGGLCKLYRAATSLKEFSLDLGIAQDGGKDSGSLAMKVDNDLVKSPETLVCKVYAPIEDVTKVLTPDIKMPGESTMIHVDLANGRRRLGGSAFAQALGQLGSECPDVDDPGIILMLFELMMDFIDQDLVLAFHDTSADGVLVTLAEMAFAGNCGLEVDIPGKESTFAEMFAKEPGVIIEVKDEDVNAVTDFLKAEDIPFLALGKTKEEKELCISHQGTLVLADQTDVLRQKWEETAYQIEKLQINPECADAEKANTAEGLSPVYELTFDPQPTTPEILVRTNKPKVAILREQGTNGEREMAAAFEYVGFDARDILVKHLVSGEKNLDGFSGLVWCGGFSYMDVFVAGKAVALKVWQNQVLSKMFQAFRNNPTTWSLGVCNGDQIMKQMRWLYPGMGDDHPLSVQNISGIFESRWVNVRIPENTKAMMFREMAGSSLGINIAHGEGRFWTPDGDASYFLDNGLVGMQYIDRKGNPTADYPFNPNGSVSGITSLCSPCGRHLAMMPHPERTFRRFQWPWMPREWSELKASPWVQMFQTARENS